MDNCIIGLKYCGGCNPRFDRKAWVNGLRAACPGTVFVAAGQETPQPEAFLVVCGCSARCADTTGLRAAGGCLTVTRAEDLDAAVTFIKNVQKGN